MSKILPDDSLIFKIVRDDDLTGLQMLLSNRQGTLRDRDSRGTPLLHVSVVSLIYIQPKPEREVRALETYFYVSL
jgi:hypothetical protein